MNQRRQFFIAFFGFCFALIGIQSATPAAGGSGNNQEIRIEGTLVAINLPMSKVSIRTAQGAIVVVSIQAATKVERNGVRARLAAFKAGDRAQARIARASGLTTKFEAVGP